MCGLLGAAAPLGSTLWGGHRAVIWVTCSLTRHVPWKLGPSVLGLMALLSQDNILRVLRCPQSWGDAWVWAEGGVQAPVISQQVTHWAMSPEGGSAVFSEPEMTSPSSSFGVSQKIQDWGASRSLRRHLVQSRYLLIRKLRTTAVSHIPAQARSWSPGNPPPDSNSALPVYPLTCCSRIRDIQGKSWGC